MAKKEMIEQFDWSGEKTGELSLPKALLTLQVPDQAVLEYVLAIRKNMRQWSASTQGRSEVSHSNKKPRKQKGTGGARQGSLAAPQFRGGGVVFGPRPKFLAHQRINKTQRRKVNTVLLIEKITAGRAIVLGPETFYPSAISTKETKQWICSRFPQSQGEKILFLAVRGEKEDNLEGAYNLAASLGNLQGTRVIDIEEVNAYGLLRSHALVFSKRAFERLAAIDDGEKA